MNSEDYDTDTPVELAIEIRLADHGVYLGTYHASGAISHSYTGPSGLPLALGNVQSTRTCPRKAVRGWQREMIDFFNNSLRPVSEVR